MQGERVVKVCCVTPKKKGDARYGEISVDIGNLIEQFKPDALVIESQYLGFLGTNSVLKVSTVQGIIVGIFEWYCYKNKKEPLFVYVSPSEAKSVVGVQGRLKRGESKQAVRKMVGMMYPELKEEKQDILDAVAIGLAGFYKLTSH